MHGGAAPQNKRAREQRIALAEALAADPRRRPDEVMADVLHQADYLMRLARESVQAGPPTAELMGAIERAETAGRWAKTSLDADVDQRQTRLLESQASLLAAVISRILDRLELSASQQELVSVVVVEELERVSTAGELGAGRG